MNIQLNDKWRVVTCKDDHQWVLEHRKGNQWKGRSYFRTREALLRVSIKLAGEIDPLAWSKLLGLPRLFKPSVEAQKPVLERQVDDLGTYPPEENTEPLLPTYSVEGENA
jgi:hypothetical protein